MCDTILELDDQTLYKYKGNYSYYLEKREERKENALANRAKARGIFKRELEWMRSTPSARTGKSKSRIERFTKSRKRPKTIRKTTLATANPIASEAKSSNCTKWRTVLTATCCSKT